MINSFRKRTLIRLLREINYVLNAKRKFQLLILFFLMIFSGLSEMITIAAIYPYINLINNPEKTLKKPIKIHISN